MGTVHDHVNVTPHTALVARETTHERMTRSGPLSFLSSLGCHTESVRLLPPQPKLPDSEGFCLLRRILVPLEVRRHRNNPGRHHTTHPLRRALHSSASLTRNVPAYIRIITVMEQCARERTNTVSKQRENVSLTNGSHHRQLCGSCTMICQDSGHLSLA